jgi:[ribosomal protein S5]-alanine N-acetyltransferase
MAIRGLRHLVNLPRTPDPATGRAQCGRADPGWCLTVRVEPLTLEWIEALVEGDGVFTARFGIPVEAGWEGFPEALRPTLEDVRRNGADPWGSHLFFDDDGTLVGFGGFKGPPRHGEVEIGYAVAPARQGRGLATAAATALVERARAAHVGTVVAHTLAEENASCAVLRRCGFHRVATGRDPDAGVDAEVWRWELTLTG